MIIFFVLLCILGVHTTGQLTLPNGVGIPYFGVACAILLASLICPKWEIRIQKTPFWCFIAYAVLAIVITIAAAKEGYVQRSIKGVLQLMYSLFLAAGLYILILRSSVRVFSTLCLSVLVVLAVAATLEAHGPLKPVSDKFRETFCVWVYQNDTRDILEHGTVRAKVFSPEPSTAAITFFWVSLAWAWTCRLRIGNGLLWGASVIAMFWAVRSPFFVVAVVMIPITLALAQMNEKTRKRFTTWGPIRYLLVLSVCVLGVLFINLFLKDRISAFLANGDGSFVMRFSGPLQFLYQFLPEHKIVGVGVVGDLEMLTSQIEEVYLSLGMTWISSQPAADVARSISNCLALHFIYFGAIGGVVQLSLLIIATRLRSRIKWVLLLAQLAALCLMLGGYNSAMVWGSCAAVFAAARLNETNGAYVNFVHVEKVPASLKPELKK